MGAGKNTLVAVIEVKLEGTTRDDPDCFAQNRADIMEGEYRRLSLPNGTLSTRVISAECIKPEPRYYVSDDDAIVMDRSGYAIARAIKWSPLDVKELAQQIADMLNAREEASGG